MSGTPLDHLKEAPGVQQGESSENRVKRLSMRSMRRGIKEMDIILSKYADAHLADMNRYELDLYEALLGENDQDLYQWVSGQVAAPQHLTELVEHIARFNGAR